MTFASLGGGELKISRLGLGSWAFAADGFWGEQDEKDSSATIRAALDMGINLIDSSEMYGAGRSEEVIGKALQGLRDKAVIATKAASANLGRDGLVAACERSLSRLRTDYIDLYQVHWRNPEVPIGETMEAMYRLVKDGKVRYVGVCNFGAGDLAACLETAGRIVSDQLPYNLLWRAIEDEIIPACVDRGVGIIAYSPLANGLLSGKYGSAREVPPGRTSTRIFAGTGPASRHGEKGLETEAFDAIAAIRGISERIAIPLPTLAIAWLLGQSALSSVLAGARNPAQLRDLVASLECGIPAEVNDELLEATNALKQKLGNNADLWQGSIKSRIK